MRSVWIEGSSQRREHPALAGATRADVAIVGGGITGLTTALALARAGRRVVLVEAGRLGEGNTGRSTGNLYATVAQGLATIRRKWGEDVAAEVVAWRGAAVREVESLAGRIPGANFVRCPQVLALEGDDEAALEELERELDAVRAAGLDATLVDAVPELGFPLRRALRIEAQAQINPYAYAQGLAAAAADAGAALHERSCAIEVDASEGLVRTNGGEVRADVVVFATHTPKGFNLVQAEMEPFLEYGVAARVERAPMPDGIYWVRDRKRSIRVHHAHDGDWLVVVGESHKTGHHEDGADYPARLREYAASHFPGIPQAASHAWSAQQYRPADGLPYIGRSAHDNVLIATGFAADGLTWGTLAATLVDDLVAGRESAATKRLTPRRFTAAKSAAGWARENADVVAQWAHALFSPADLLSLEAVPRGEGRIVKLEGGKHAVYRAPDGELAVLSPICPHLKCEVKWNPDATTWDCPCHGSRFECTGAVIEGPAYTGLARRDAEGHPRR